MSDFIEVPANQVSIKSRKVIYGMCINDADYMTQRRNPERGRLCCPYYRVWREMIRRCYSEKSREKYPSYKDCYVATEWHRFSVFKEWMKAQDWQGKQLDKDIKTPNNKIYSKDTCIFVTGHINSVLVDSKIRRGKWPRGVYYDKERSMFKAKCSAYNKTVELGRYSTPEAAYSAYIKFKKAHLTELANQPENEYIKEYLLNHAAVLE